MKIQAISFTGKNPKAANPKKIYNEALARIFGQSNRDFISLTKNNKPKAKINTEKLIKDAKKFFSHVFGQ